MELPTDEREREREIFIRNNLHNGEYYRYVTQVCNKKKNHVLQHKIYAKLLAVFRGREMVFRHSHHKFFTLQIFCPIRNMLAVVRGRD